MNMNLVGVFVEENFVDLFSSINTGNSANMDYFFFHQTSLSFKTAVKEKKISLTQNNICSIIFY